MVSWKPESFSVVSCLELLFLQSPETCQDLTLTFFFFFDVVAF